jgi:hypothetical protein
MSRPCYNIYRTHRKKRRPIFQPTDKRQNYYPGVGSYYQTISGFYSVLTFAALIPLAQTTDNKSLVEYVQQFVDQYTDNSLKVSGMYR